MIAYSLAERVLELPLARTVSPRAEASPTKLRVSLSVTSTPEDKDKMKMDAKFKKQFHLPPSEYVIRSNSNGDLSNSCRIGSNLHIG